MVIIIKSEVDVTNVPATLDQIINMLPRLSSEVQYHPMKLKKKIRYKSYYMYNYIHKDVVASAIKCLQENNQLYGDIEINDRWADDWINSDLSTLLNECGEYASSSDDQTYIPTTSSQITTEINMEVSDTDNIPDSNITSTSSQSTTELNMEVNNTPDINITNDVILEEKELEEDHIAAVKSVTLIGKPTANMMQFENLENEIYTVAAGENNIPCYMLMDDEFEVLGFPDMFPCGTGGYCTSGTWYTKLSLRTYFHQWLLNVDGCFASNVENVFCAQYDTDIKQIKSDSNLALHLKHGQTLDGKIVTAGMLKNPDVMNWLVKTEQAYKFLKHV